MTRIFRPLMVACGVLLAAASSGTPTGTHQQNGARRRIVGAWIYVSVDTVRPDGSRSPMYGAHPQGLVVFDESGHYALVNARSDLPRYASGDRMKGSPEEYRTIAHGSIAHFGTYTVDDSDQTITFHIEASTFPNWNRTVQVHPFATTGDELRYPDAVWRRAK